MASKRKRNQKWIGGYGIGFQDSDFQWLAKRFQKSTAQNPDLTLEAFAIQHGVQPEWISRFLSQKQDGAVVARSQGTQGKWKPSRARRRNRNEERGRLMHFESTNLARLAKELQGQTDLTHHAFAAHHGIESHWLERFINTERRVLTVWHGTTEDRARAIVQQGFKKRGNSGLIWFTKLPNFACRVAASRARHRRRHAVVISCQIDLEKTPSFGKQASHVHIFPSPVNREVIANVSLVIGRQFRLDAVKTRWPDVKVTQESRQQDILSWLNQYLSLENEEAIGKDHPAVKAIFKWVKAQYATGRKERISDEEMLSLVMIVRSIPGLEIGLIDSLPSEDDDDELIDVVITKTSGKLGVLWWVNRYQELADEEPVSEDNPAIEAIFKWVEKEYNDGRDNPISDEEMLIQVTKYLK